jgi:hypothetical protein
MHYRWLALILFDFTHTTGCWEMHLRSVFNMDYQAEMVKQLVLMTEKYAPHDWGVGGPVDIAEIVKHSGPRWIVRKPECQP